MNIKNNNSYEIVIVGLGYVGLPLAIEFSKIYNVIGFDISEDRIGQLNEGIDLTGEVSTDEIILSKNFKATNDTEIIKSKDIYIITVPTPINNFKEPDLSSLENAAKLVGKVMKKGSIIVIESTVYPGVTEDIIQPILARESKLVYKKDFNIGYSPERVNPGDKHYTVSNIVKVVSGDTSRTKKILVSLYSQIIKAGIHECSSIKVAEASKAIENAQRDINIAFVNEVAMICKALKINSSDVFDAAKSKWNFLSFKPGLVGGHCIGVDPYYLAKAALNSGCEPKIILAGREINDDLVTYIFRSISNKLKKNARILVLGITFKENVPDLRNSKSAELAVIFRENGFNVDVHDPKASLEVAMNEYNIKLVKPEGKYDCLIGAVSHKEFVGNNKMISSLITKGGLLVDIKGIWKKVDLPKHIETWSL